MFDRARLIWCLGRESIQGGAVAWKGLILDSAAKDVRECNTAEQVRDVLNNVRRTGPSACVLVTGTSGLVNALEEAPAGLVERIVDLQLVIRAGALRGRMFPERSVNAILGKFLAAASEGQLGARICAALFAGNLDGAFGGPPADQPRLADLHLWLRRMLGLILRGHRRYGQLAQLLKYELPAQRVLIGQSFVPIRVNLEGLRVVIDELEEDVRMMRSRLLVRDGVDPAELNSSSQVRTGYFAPLVGRHRASDLGGQDVLSALEDLESTHPLSLRLAEYYRNLRSLRALQSLQFGGEVGTKPTFDALGTVTGRIVMRHPGLQWLAKTHRRFVLPHEGCELRYFDYACFEPTILAVASGDDGLLSACKRDLYQEVAEWLTLPPANSRKVAKVFFLSYLYGRRRSKLVQDLMGHCRIDEVTAAGHLQSFRARLGVAIEYEQALRRRALRDGVVVTRVGNSRRISKKQAYLALNHYLQGTAATIFKTALTKVFVPGVDVLLIAPMHDGLVCSIPHDRVEALSSDIVRAMESAFIEVMGRDGVRITVQDVF